MKLPLLVLCIDRDNDLFEKASISGPVFGRANNITAATKLSLADPEDPDSNTIFYAVKLFDKLKKDGIDAEVITLTGDKSLGYVADRAISFQLDKIIRETHASSCILVSDGASDEEILPIIKSRIKVDSTKVVFIKQAKELEKTYFVLLEKLKDPHYAKILLGIPALLLLIFGLSRMFGLGLDIIALTISLLLFLRLLGVDTFFFNLAKEFRFSVEKSSWVSYVSAIALFITALMICYQSFFDGMRSGFNQEKLIAYVIRNTSLLLLFSFLLILVGKSIDAISEKRKFIVTKYSMYGVALILAFLVLKVGSDWVLNLEPPYVSFSDFLATLVLAIFIGYGSTYIIGEIRSSMVQGMKLEGKEVITQQGTYLGKVIGVDPKTTSLVVQTMFDKRYFVSFGSILSIGDNILTKAEG
ncbi:MAG: DUF373 family protein [Candidatus Micrarchaeota archaeon]